MRRQWITFLRILRYGLNNFSRNAWLTTAATAVMTITLVIILTTFTARLIFSDTIQEVRSRIDISVYLKDDAEPADINRFGRELQQVPIVTSVEHISKEQAREIFTQENKAEFEELEALGEIGDNPFPASLRIKTSDPNKLDDLNAVIQKPENLALQSEEPSNSGERKAAIDTIARVSQFSEIAGLAAGGIFVVISIMIIFNTIRMAIFNRRDEIEIMRLIGAEKRFIRGPFIVEAALYGLVAAIVSLVLVYSLLLTRAGELATVEIEVANTVAFFKQWPLVIVPAQLAIGVLIGVFSAYLAIRRYLKV
jgi:cell division transport system permease protein